MRFLSQDFKGDYWHSEAELKSYDITFAQRIAWKWDYVLEELSRLGWQLPGTRVLDWACGTGVAGRALKRFYPQAEISYFDQSALAQNFALSRLPEAKKWERSAPVDIVVLSHVLNELGGAELEQLLNIVAQAQAVIWIEPGTKTAGKSLPQLRDKLFMQGFKSLAPCTHFLRCPLLQEAQGSDWCHHFAPTPSEVFQDAFWSEFSNRMGIDLSSLPLSYLVLQKQAAPLVGDEHSRLIGQARHYKGYSKILSCDKVGLRELSLQKRDDPELLKQIKKSTSSRLGRWEVVDGKIVSGTLR